MPELNPLAQSRRASTLAAVRLEEMKQLVGKLGASHWDVTEMMLVMIQDGLSAMAYGQYGGSVPDPTGNTVIDGNQDSPRIWARDSVAEARLAEYETAIEAMHRNALVADSIRRTYTSANMDIIKRLDPVDFCRTHWHLQLYEGHRRVRGDMCKLCAGFYDDNGREPTATEADFYHRHGRWPHRLVDPKERRAV